MSDGATRWSKPTDFLLSEGLSRREAFEEMKAQLPPGVRFAIATKGGCRYFVNFTLTPLAYTQVPAKP